MVKPGRRELNKIQCRQKILDASRQLFTTQGYDSTTIEEIADAAEISKATLYNYFSSKETLLLGIADTALEECRRIILVDMKDEPSSVQKLRRVIEILALDSARYLSLARRILYLSACKGSELHHSRQDLFRILEHLVLEGQEKGELRSDLEPQIITEAFFGVYLLTQMGWDEILGWTESECLARVNGCIDLALSGLTAQQPDPTTII